MKKTNTSRIGSGQFYLLYHLADVFILTIQQQLKFLVGIS